MPTSRIRIDFEKMNSVSRAFEQQGSAVRATIRSLKEKLGVLQAGDWVGGGANKFYQEMESAVLPSLQRLATALEAGAQTTAKIGKIMHQAEEDAAALFRLNATVGAMGSAPAAGLSHGTASGGNGSGISSQLHRTPIAAGGAGTRTPIAAGGGGGGTKEPVKDGISIDDINQGGYGDCFVMAPAAALAKSHSDLLAKRIHDNGNGTYDVTLYHKPETWEEIMNEVASGNQPGWQTTRVSQADLAKYPQFTRANRKNPDELWPALIEEAYIQQRAQRDELGYLGKLGSFPQHVAAVKQGGYKAVALEALTGVPSQTFDPSKMSITELEQQVVVAKNPVVVDTPGEFSLPHQTVTQILAPKVYGDRLVPGHSYTVTGVDTINNTVTVRNPWGDGVTQETPYVTLPYPVFQTMFESGAISPLNK